jgi:hypothetical protein
MSDPFARVIDHGVTLEEYVARFAIARDLANVVKLACPPVVGSTTISRFAKSPLRERLTTGNDLTIVDMMCKIVQDERPGILIRCHFDRLDGELEGVALTRLS